MQKWAGLNPSTVKGATLWRHRTHLAWRAESPSTFAKSDWDTASKDCMPLPRRGQDLVLKAEPRLERKTGALIHLIHLFWARIRNTNKTLTTSAEMYKTNHSIDDDMDLIIPTALNKHGEKNKSAKIFAQTCWTENRCVSSWSSVRHGQRC
jgi:hypothetical protein